MILHIIMVATASYIAFAEVTGEHLNCITQCAIPGISLAPDPNP